ncbi:MAG: hypothetical protein LBQ60_10790 [Bacteroidales bacterium]|jgi:hypothetical protein|nr:hypothetical protein [Bacteroidales bacterium]
MKITNKGIIIWVLICAILYFLLNKGIGNVTLYMITSLSLSFYFFPIKPILEIFKYKSIKPKTIIFIFLSNCVLASVLSFTVVKRYIPDNEIIDIISSLFYIFNGLLAYYNLFIKDDKDVAFLHFMFLMFR